MTTESPRLPLRYAHLSGMGMLALLVLSAYFWQERAWLLDVAYQTVLMLRDETTQVQVYRFGAALVQALPLAAIKLELPLSWVSWCYSVSFTLWYGLFFVLIVWVFRQYFLAVVLVLLYTAMVYDGFYWCTSELQQGLGFLLVFWAMVLRFPALRRWWLWPLLVISCVGLAFYHPLVAIPFLGCWAYFGWYENDLRHGRYLLLLGVMLLVLWVKSQWFGNYYDAAKMAVFQKQLAEFPRIFHYPAYEKFFWRTLLYWWGFPLLLGVVTVAHVRYRQWWVLGGMWLACAGFLVLNVLGSPQATYRFYSEVNFYPLVLIVAVPLAHYVLPRWQFSRWTFPLLGLFIVLRLAVITQHHEVYTERLDYLEQLVQQAQQEEPGQRYLVSEAQVDMDKLVMTWGTPFETLLLTAAAHQDSVVTLCVTPDLGRYPDALRTQGSELLMEFYPIPFEALPATYLRFGPGSYEMLTTDF
ncbi:MAG: hypothetical protein AAGJ82_11855 [Bacteroidota bacterium]